MGALAVVWNILYTLLLIYFFVMWARFVLDLVRTFNRSWRPRGAWPVSYTHLTLPTILRV